MEEQEYVDYTNVKCSDCANNIDHGDGTCSCLLSNVQTRCDYTCSICWGYIPNELTVSGKDNKEENQ